MTDRELLERAAKAAGIEALRLDAHPQHALHWDALADDGDALRLAVTLGLLVYVMPAAGFTAIRLPGEHIGGKYDEVQTHGSDPFAATRRAIVRAAAAMGGE